MQCCYGVGFHNVPTVLSAVIGFVQCIEMFVNGKSRFHQSLRSIPDYFSGVLKRSGWLLLQQ